MMNLICAIPENVGWCGWYAVRGYGCQARQNPR